MHTRYVIDVIKGKLDKSGVNETLGLVSEAIFEYILLVEVVDDLQIVCSKVLKVDEDSLELPHHLIVEINLGLGDVCHVSFPPVFAKLNH